MFVCVCVCVCVCIYIFTCMHTYILGWQVTESDGINTRTFKTQFSRHSIREQHRLPAVHTHTPNYFINLLCCFVTKLLH